MKIDCLMGTYGRHARVCESLACFLQQSAIENATLLIYNQHPVPLKFDHARVRVVNDPALPRALRYIRQRMFELADPDADLIHFWDDDDLYLPWHLTDCLTHIGSNVAWKPSKSWYSFSTADYDLTAEMFEGSWIFRADYMARAPIDTHPNYIDHPVYPQTNQAGLVAMTDLGAQSSYIYRWYRGWTHLASFGGSHLPELQQRNRIMLRDANTDVQPNGRLVPADLAPIWRQYLSGTRQKVSTADWEINRQRLKLDGGKLDATGS